MKIWILFVVPFGLFVSVSLLPALGADVEIEIREQVPKAMSYLNAWEQDNSEKKDRYLHIVYWTPSDREPAADYQPRLQRMLEHIQAFYSDEMKRLGFGARTIQFNYGEGQELVVHLVEGQAPYAEYNVQSGNKIKQECVPTLEAAGIDVKNETIVIFCNMADWDAENRALTHRSPYYAGGSARGGTAWQLDSPILDTVHLANKGDKLRDGQYGYISMGKHNSIFIGGIAHELGHSLGLPHCRERPDERAVFGTALMGSGNRTYGNELRGEGKGSFLTLAHGLRLASHPQFSGSVKQLHVQAKAKIVDPMIKQAGKGFTFTGRVEGDLPVYAVIGYMDPEGGGDYDATTTTSIPDAQGNFTLHCQALRAGKKAKLKVVACFVNGSATGNVGAWSPFVYDYSVDKKGGADVRYWSHQMSLAPLVKALAHPQDKEAIRAGVQFAKAHAAGEETAGIARRLLQSMEPGRAFQQAASIPAEAQTFTLSDLKPDFASVGWLKPVLGRVPHPDALFECGSQIFTSGIYAHAPAEHRYELSGQWKMLSGRCGMYDRNNGSVVFVIEGDGKELFRSGLTRNGGLPRFEVSVEGVKELRLIVEDGGDGSSNDWGLWLEPMLSR